jgi:hypothetical protein
LQDNMYAGFTPLPDAKTRQRMAEFIAGL